MYLFICADLSIQEFRGCSQSGDQEKPKSFVFLPLSVACVGQSCQWIIYSVVYLTFPAGLLMLQSNLEDIDEITSGAL